MRRLVLLRHAKAEAASRGGDDYERVLTERGRQDAREIGRILAEHGEAPNLALVSTAARARETWECAQDAFKGARLELKDALYNATAKAIGDHVDAYGPDAEVVMVVGHNPGLQEYAVRLLVRSSAAPSEVRRLTDAYPTAAAAVFTFDEAGRGSLTAFHRPRRDAEA